jgi:hypothetical protein
MGTAWKFFFPGNKTLRLVRLEVCSNTLKTLTPKGILSQRGEWPTACNRYLVNRLRITLLAGGALFLAAPVALASQVSLPDQSAAPGTSVLIPVAFAGEAASVSGVQFDIGYDNSAMSLVITVGDAASASEKSLYIADVAPNKKRVLIVGLNQNLILDGTLVNLFANINDDAPNGVYALGLWNVCGSDPSGNSTPVTGSDAALTVQEAGSQGLPLQAQGVLNAANLLPGPVAASEIIAQIGSGIGPASPRQIQRSLNNSVLGGTSWLFEVMPASDRTGGQRFRK